MLAWTSGWLDVLGLAPSTRPDPAALSRRTPAVGKVASGRRACRGGGRDPPRSVRARPGTGSARLPRRLRPLVGRRRPRPLDVRPDRVTHRRRGHPAAPRGRRLAPDSVLGGQPGHPSTAHSPGPRRRHDGARHRAADRAGLRCRGRGGLRHRRCVRAGGVDGRGAPAPGLGSRPAAGQGDRVRRPRCGGHGAVRGCGAGPGAGARLRYDDDGLLPSVAATVVVAAVFSPARQRLERAARRLVFGERADPYATLAALPQRLVDAPAADEVLPATAQTIARGLGADLAGVSVCWLGVAHSPPGIRDPRPKATPSSRWRYATWASPSASCTSSPVPTGR